MLVTNHVLAGAVAGAAARRPLPAFVLGVASHFLLDAVPHWGKWADERQFLRVAVADGLTGLAAMTALLAVTPPGRRTAVGAGMTGGALPDLDKPSLLCFGRSPWPRAVDRFHAGIQDEAPGRFPREAAAAILLTATALTMLRRQVPARS